MICSTQARLAGCLLALVFNLSPVQAQQSAPATEAAATVSPAAPAVTAAAPAPIARPAPAPATAAVQPYAGNAAGSLLQTIFALCVVLGLLAVLAWAMKRYGPKAVGGSAHVRMVGGLNLGGRERIIVVEVGEQWIVVGASPGRVNALATMPRQGGLDSTQAAATLVATADQAPRPASSFGDWLKQTIEKRNAN